jgi:PAS domain S-box-containing protein
MRDKRKNGEERISELGALHCRNAQFAAAEAECEGTERALEDQLHFLQTLVDTIPNPIFYKDTGGHFLGCNKAFEKRIGLSKDEIVGKTSYDLFPKEFADKYHEMDMESFANPGEQIYENTLLYADRKVHDIITYKGTFTAADGTLAGLVEVAVDISERKKGEEFLRKAHDELELRVAERTADLARANEELRKEIAERKLAEEALRKSSEKLKLFAYSVAHDLKSPSIGIYGLTKLLWKKYHSSLDEKASKYCSQILRASENVVALVEKINIYAATTVTSLAIEKVNPKEIFQILRDEFSTQLSIREIEWSEPAVIPEIDADRIAILRIFRNFVDNALKYGGKDLSKVIFRYAETEGTHVFSVSDDGVGIKRKDWDKIFGLFQRIETSRGVPGTGLGLAIVKEIAEQHRGSVWVESGTQDGSTFYVSIAKDLS